MLWLALSALAAPLSPAPIDPTGLEVAAVFKSDRSWLRDLNCAKSDCQAVRQEGTSGLQVDWRPIKAIGFFVHGEHVAEKLAAAEYSGSGYGVGGGVKFGSSITQQLGLYAWGDLTWRSTESAADEEAGEPAGLNSAQRYTVELGGDLTLGSADDNFIGWIGAGVEVFGSDVTQAVSGTLDVETMPFLPVQGDLGVMVVSDPLGGPWATRGRLACGISANLGYRSGLGISLAAAF